MDAKEREAFRRHVAGYIRVFIALLVATVLTVAVSYVHFGRHDSHAGNIAVALVIAVVKAGLVAAFFMHLAAEKRSIYTMLGCTAVFFAGLMALTVWSAMDLPQLSSHYRVAPRKEAANTQAAEDHVP